MSSKRVLRGKEIHEGAGADTGRRGQGGGCWRKEADAWAAAEPDNAMAKVALGDAKLRQGDPRGAMVEFSTARHATDPCNPRALYGMAEVDSIAGFGATAKRGHRTSVRSCIPPTTTSIRAGSRLVSARKRLTLLADYAEHSSEMSDEDRAALKTRLSKQAQYHASDCRMAPSSPRETKIPMVPLMDDYQFIGWALDVQFNGKRRQLWIDTGASGDYDLCRMAAVLLGIKRE